MDTKNSTSISDYDKYKQFCLNTATTDLFYNFRRHPECTQIIETVDKHFGQEYLNLLKQRQNIDPNNFKDNDKIGNPRTHFYYNLGEFAPTTLRYIKTLSDILSIIGIKKLGYNPKICEVGVGYGGLCSVISKHMNCRYYLFDLNETLLMAKKFLDELNIKAKYIPSNQNFPKTQFSLFISNYAYSELSKEIQDLYIDIINLSKNGYITYNNISSQFNVDSYSLEDLLSKINQDVCVMDEYPLTYQGNKIIVW